MNLKLEQTESSCVNFLTFCVLLNLSSLACKALQTFAYIRSYRHYDASHYIQLNKKQQILTSHMRLPQCTYQCIQPSIEHDMIGSH
jgi:hypothetical protein